MIGKIPLRYRHVRVDNSDFNEKEMAILKKVLADERSLLLTGKTGTGKTHLAACIFNLARKASKFWCEPAELIYEMRRFMFSKAIDAPQLLKDLMTGVMNAELLVLDDLGVEPETEETKGVMRRILLHRYNYKKWTIITTNLDGKALVRRYSERIVSRIYEDFVVVKANGRDRRKEKFGGVVEI